jgi:hypothetical protein
MFVSCVVVVLQCLPLPFPHSRSKSKSLLAVALFCSFTVLPCGVPFLDLLATDIASLRRNA